MKNSKPFDYIIWIYVGPFCKIQIVQSFQSAYNAYGVKSESVTHYDNEKNGKNISTIEDTFKLEHTKDVVIVQNQ